MHGNPMCISCVRQAQEKRVADKDVVLRVKFLELVENIFKEYGEKESTPAFVERINDAYVKVFGGEPDFTEAKSRYNQLLLSKEIEIEAIITASAEPVKECIKYVCAANYIDFSAVDDVNEKTLDGLLEKVQEDNISEAEYLNFINDLNKAKTLVYLIDNCGEIVLDKIFIKVLQNLYPDIHITAVVRGGQAQNDCTMEEAIEVGLDKCVDCIDNGNRAPGTVLSRLSNAAAEAIRNADVIISKGQGNFESLYGEGLNPYYMFLCKCNLFVQRFGLERFCSVFVREENIKEI